MNVSVLFRYGFRRWMSARQTLMADALLKLRKRSIVGFFRLRTMIALIQPVKE